MSEAEKFRWKFAALLIVIVGATTSLRLAIEMASGMPLNLALVIVLEACALLLVFIALVVAER